MRSKVVWVSILSVVLTPVVLGAEVFSLKPAMAGEDYSADLPEILKTVHGREVRSPSKRPEFHWRLAQGDQLPWLSLSGKGIASGLPDFKGGAEQKFEVIVTDASLKASPEIRIFFSVLVVDPKLSLSAVKPPRLTLESVGNGAGVAPVAVTSQANDFKHDGPRTCGEDSCPECPGILDPATFVRIIEDTGKKRIRLYEPGGNRILAADPASTILFDLTGVPQDALLNKLFITARLKGKDETKPIEVNGYSKIGESKEDAESQAAFAFNTASDMVSRLINLHDTTHLLVRRLYPGCDPKVLRDPNGHCPVRLEAKKISPILEGIYPNSRALAEFFEQAEDSPLVRMIANEFFRADGDGVVAIARKIKGDLEKFLDPKVKEEEKGPLMEQILSWTRVIWGHLETVHEQDKNHRFGCVAKKRYLKIVKELRKRIVPGTISLAKNGAENEGILYVKIEARQADGKQGLGLVAEFEVRLRHFSSRVAVTPTLMFIRRLGVDAAEAEIPNVTPGMMPPAPVNKVNFTPFPGATFGVTFFTRKLEKDGGFFKPSTGGWSRFRQIMSPGVGVNVTFMNFDDPDFDTTTGKFTTTNGSNVQFGAGIVGSLFNNRLQFTYGWNLNVDSRRRYFGIGFDFIKVGKEFAKYLPKAK